MKPTTIIPLARVKSELMLAGINTNDTDKNTLYALIKVYRCFKLAAEFAMKSDAFVAYLNDPAIRASIAQDCSDLSSLKNVCDLIMLQTKPHQQRCDLNGVILLEWEKRVAEKILKQDKLPKIKEDRRRYNRYHFGKFVTYMTETFKLTGQFKQTVQDFALDKVGKATESDWTANDLNWGWQRDLIVLTIEQWVEQNQQLNDPQATANL